MFIFIYFDLLDLLDFKLSRHYLLFHVSVFRFAELICVEQLRRLEADSIPSVLRVDLLVNLAK